MIERSTIRPFAIQPQEVIVSYEAEISRANPTCFFFLIDQSSSMLDPIMGVQGNPSKADFVADAINRVIQSLVVTATKDSAVLRYYQIGALGYGNLITSPLDYISLNQQLVWIDDLAASPIRIEVREKLESDGAGGVIKVSTRFPVWIESYANGRTPMCEALSRVKTIMDSWVQEHPNSYPPTIINFTDGEANDDGDPTAISEGLKSAKTNDGEVLIFTLHVSSNQFSQSVVCPDVDELLPDAPSKRMFNMSSSLTDSMIKIAKEQFQTELTRGAKAFVYNANIEQLVNLLDIGTWPSNMR